MADSKMKLQIISPDRIFYEGEATMVEMTTTEGEIGVYPGHIPLTNMMSPGIVNIREEGGTKQAAVHAGFVQILPKKVTILAEIAEWPDEIDINRAREAEERARRRLSDRGEGIDVVRAEMALRRALTRIGLAGK